MEILEEAGAAQLSFGKVNSRRAELLLVLGVGLGDRQGLSWNRDTPDVALGKEVVNCRWQ